MPKRESSLAPSCHQAGLTILEILIASLIMAVVLFTMASLFVGGKAYILHARSRMAGGEFGKVFIDPQQMDVRMDTWDNASANNSLVEGVTYCDSNASHSKNPLCPASTQINNITYNAQYNVTNVTNTTLRRVKMDLNWTEIQP